MLPPAGARKGSGQARCLAPVPAAVWPLGRAQHRTSRHPRQASCRSKARFHGSVHGVLGSQA